jgi:hypothetical protein
VGQPTVQQEEKMKLVLGIAFVLATWSPIFYLGFRIFVDGAVD